VEAEQDSRLEEQGGVGRANDKEKDVEKGMNKE
jgi:hypothetical protein